METHGSILGPLLFTLYINDLPSVCPNTSIQMYADDTIIYIHRSSVSQVANQVSNLYCHCNMYNEIKVPSNQCITHDQQHIKTAKIVKKIIE